MINPEEFIGQLKKLHPQLVESCTYGNCYQFYLLLKMVFPEAEAYYDSNHVITKINGRFYDINGEVNCAFHLLMAEHYPKLLQGEAAQWSWNAINDNSILPEYKPSEPMIDDYKDGWNDCIFEMIKRINRDSYVNISEGWNYIDEMQ